MKDEDKTYENEVAAEPMETIIGNHRKELHAMQKYKSEAILLENQLKGSKAIIEDFAKAIRQLKEHNYTQAKEIDRLNEYVQILEMEKKN